MLFDGKNHRDNKQSHINCINVFQNNYFFMNMVLGLGKKSVLVGLFTCTGHL